jgi:putative SOS response-associated peptidase YedK
MCGRFTLISRPASIGTYFDVPNVPDFGPRYNIAPTQNVAAIRGAGTGRECIFLRWGLIPFWAEDKKIGARLINARGDTVASKPAFRDAFRKRRCLIPADGYYEWKAVGKRKQPFYYRLRDGSPLAFAGLWEHWERGGETIESCSIITTEANELAAPVHDRMPALLPRRACELWLDPNVDEPLPLLELLRPYPADQMCVSAVNPVVNSSRYEGPECIEACGAA